MQDLDKRSQRGEASIECGSNHGNNDRGRIDFISAWMWTQKEPVRAEPKEEED